MVRYLCLVLLLGLLSSAAFAGQSGGGSGQTPLAPPTASDDFVSAAVDAEPVEADGPLYPVTELTVRYFREHPGLPAIDELLDSEVALTLLPSGFVSPRGGEPTIKVRIGDVGSVGEPALYLSALNQITGELVRKLNELDIIGVYAAPDLDQIDLNAGEDLRDPRDTSLEIIIYTGAVTDVRTIASGNRIPREERLNNPKHARILRLSPIGAYDELAGDDEAERRDLIRRDKLDEFVLRLNRHPGRRVDVALAPGERATEAVLDYLVAENRPWTIYAQASNTGTESTSDWRERFGFQHTQLTNNDDILSIDYITANFDAAHAVIGSYEFPIGDSEKLRGRVSGNYSDFTASDVGITADVFEGEGYGLGGQLIYNIYQQRDFFIDFVGGIRWEEIEVFNSAVGVGSRENLFLGEIGLQAEQQSELSQLDLGISLEFNVPGIAGTGDEGLEGLGRLQPDERFQVLRYSGGLTLYLDPIFGGAAWKDATTPKTSTLAHELELSFRGQWSLGNRLIPNAQQVVGGLFSVRGYPESVVSGDSAVVATLEYRWHIPQQINVGAA
ncbi:MAG: ShlB/FhaC/HecB family hemolysin secretion/activation protein, partial [Planctomycetota bacterium]